MHFWIQVGSYKTVIGSVLIEKPSQDVLKIMLSSANGAAGCKHWRHSGFNVYGGPTIWPNNDQGLEDLARYIIRACFSAERMTYIAARDTLDGQAKIIYRSKDGRTSKTFDAIDWSRQRTAGCKHSLQLVTHIPNKGEQMVRYYGYYSNKSRGMRKKQFLILNGTRSGAVAAGRNARHTSDREYGILPGRGNCYLFDHLP